MAKRPPIYVCESCGRDTPSPEQLCRRCRGPEDDDGPDPAVLARLRDRFARRDRDDDAGREADEGWSYDDGELDS